MKNTRKGFTLIELVIVVAIIGILALMVIPNFATVTDDAKVKTFQSNCKTIQSAIGMYQAANKGELPATLQDLVDKEFLQKNPNGDPKDAQYNIVADKGLDASWTNKGKTYTYTTANGFNDPNNP